MQFPFPDEHILPHEIPFVFPADVSQYSDDADQFIGSLVGLAVGDALGASVEFRPHQYFLDNPVRDMEGGGTWGLKTGQWTDDTSMALCLASSLITKKGYNPYDQMVRYKWWYKHGYLSSTGRCFDIGNATRDSLEEFIHRQKSLIKYYHCREDELDYLSWNQIQSVKSFEVNCSTEGVAGNGALMRLAPVPLFFHKYPPLAVEYAGCSGRLTHGDTKAVDACRYYAALIVAAVRGEPKKTLLSGDFYKSHRQWFGSTELHPDILRIAHGSYKNPKGYEGGIRGKGYIVNALEAALWAFWSDNDSFEKGALAAVNLGDDTDTTAAIYGQLAGASYGYKDIPRKWKEKLYAHKLLVCIGHWLYFGGKQYKLTEEDQKIISSVQTSTKTFSNEQQSGISWTSADQVYGSPSAMPSTETEHALQSRSDKEDLSIHQRHYDTSRVYQQGDEQASRERSRMHRQNPEQSSNHRSEKYPSSKYQERDRLSHIQQQDTTQSSTDKKPDYLLSKYGPDLNQSLSSAQGHKGSSGYRLDIPHSQTRNADVSQMRLRQPNDKPYLPNPPTSNPSRTHPIERSLRIDTNHVYPYNINQVPSRPSMNDQRSLNDTNYMFPFGTRIDNRSERNHYSRDTDPVTTSSTIFRRPLASSNYPIIQDPYNRTYSHPYNKQDTYRERKW